LSGDLNFADGRARWICERASDMRFVALGLRCGIGADSGNKKCGEQRKYSECVFHGSSAPSRGELEGWPVQRGLHGLQTSPVSWLGEKELREELAG
jgi:hypothetical protein